MPNWNDLLIELNSTGSQFDILRRKYLEGLAKLTGRNTIIYYSGWLDKPNAPNNLLMINDGDKNGFMSTIHKLDRDNGLDLVLHTPGGELSATESIVDYLRQMFDTNIRVIVPQLAMSGGTMIACASKEIIMGKQSSLGPIDPQIGGGIPAHGILEEVREAQEQISRNPNLVNFWAPILQKYSPALIGECRKVIKWATDISKEWLRSGMFAGEEADDDIERIIKELTDHALTLSHSRHLSAKRCSELGLKIKMMEDDQDLQDAILSLHHATMHTFNATPAIKITENHLGKALVKRHGILEIPQMKK